MNAGKGHVTMESWLLLMKYMRPDTDKRQAKFFFELLDRDNNNQVCGDCLLLYHTVDVYVLRSCAFRFVLTNVHSLSSIRC